MDPLELDSSSRSVKTPELVEGRLEFGVSLFDFLDAFEVGLPPVDALLGGLGEATDEDFSPFFNFGFFFSFLILFGDFDVLRFVDGSMARNLKFHMLEKFE